MYAEKSIIQAGSDSTSLNNGNPHFDIINRSVPSTCSRILYHFYHVKPFLYLAKDSILAVKMGRASDSRVYLLLFLYQSGIVLGLLLCLCCQTVLQFLQSRTIALTPHLHNLITMLRSQLVEDGLNLLHLQLPGELAKLSFVVLLSPDDVEL